MSRKSRGPWIWEQRKRWCATIRGKRVVLAAPIDDKAGAMREWHTLMGERQGSPAAPSSITVRQLLRLHADYVKENRAPLTLEWYHDRHRSFCKEHGDLAASEARPHHVDSWLAAHDWNTATRRGAITAIASSFQWARKRGLIAANPLEGMEKPRKGRRSAIVSAAQVEAIREEMKDGAFADLFLAVLWTGCRPGEACKVEASQFDAVAGTWTIHGKTTRATGKMRVVYLPDQLVRLCSRLAAIHPSGPLFRNSEGNPWNRHAYGHRVRRMRAKLGFGKEVVLSSLRHLFITDALEQGVPIATVAELAGHSGVAMVSQAYSMLHQRTGHLKDAANLVRSISIHDRIWPEAPALGEAPPSASAPPEPPRRKPPGRKP